MGSLFTRAVYAGARAASAVFALVGIGLLRAGYPPAGTDAYVLLGIGCVFVLLGAVGILDPTKVWNSRRPRNDQVR